MNIRNFGDLEAGDMFLFRGDCGDGDTFIKALKVKSNNPAETNVPYASNMVWLDTDRGLMDYASDKMVCYDAADFDIVPFGDLSFGDKFYYDIDNALITMMKCRLGYDVYGTCIDEVLTESNDKGKYKGTIRQLFDNDFVMVEKNKGGETDA